MSTATPETAFVAPDSNRPVRWLVVLGVAFTLAFAAAPWRSGLAGRSLYWHAVVLAAGLLAGAVFHVALAGPDPEPVPVPDRSGSVCHSGGDSNECIGG